MLACVEAASAANAQVLVQGDNVPASIVAELNGAYADALVAVGAFFFVYPNNLGQRRRMR
jgi:hypothetical protein